MKIPDKIKIGAIWWQIKFVPRTDIGVDENLSGCMDEATQTIKIDQVVSDEMKEGILLHEIFHCIDMQLDHDLVETLSNQLHQVMSDNKLIFFEKL